MNAGRFGHLDTFQRAPCLQAHQQGVRGDKLPYLLKGQRTKAADGQWVEEVGRAVAVGIVAGGGSVGVARGAFQLVAHAVAVAIGLKGGDEGEVVACGKSHFGKADQIARDAIGGDEAGGIGEGGVAVYDQHEVGGQRAADTPASEVEGEGVGRV